MSNVDFSDFAPRSRKPTKKQTALYKKWRRYLADSRLTVEEQHRRAAQFASQGKTLKE